MLTVKMLNDIELGFKRVFALPITSSSFQEIQMIIITSAENDKTIATQLFEALLTGKIHSELATDSILSRLKKVIVKYSIQIQVTKEVYERGEFVNIITSDALNQKDHVLFLNRIKRIDGSEFQFITDPGSTLYILHHFANRLQDILQSEAAAKKLQNLKKELEALKDKINTLTNV